MKRGRPARSGVSYQKPFPDVNLRKKKGLKKPAAAAKAAAVAAPPPSPPPEGEARRPARAAKLAALAPIKAQIAPREVKRPPSPVEDNARPARAAALAALGPIKAQMAPKPSPKPAAHKPKPKLAAAPKPKPKPAAAAPKPKPKPTPKPPPARAPQTKFTAAELKVTIAPDGTVSFPKRIGRPPKALVAARRAAVAAAMAARKAAVGDVADGVTDDEDVFEVPPPKQKASKKKKKKGGSKKKKKRERSPEPELQESSSDEDGEGGDVAQPKKHRQQGSPPPEPESEGGVAEAPPPAKKRRGPAPTPKPKPPTPALPSAAPAADAPTISPGRADASPEDDSKRSFGRRRGSKYHGVRPGNNGKFVASIFALKTVLNLGEFKTELEAARAYDRAARKHHKDSARLNFPNEVIEDDKHNDLCEVCDVGGDVLCCDTCNLVFHLKCLKPPLTEVPEGEWQCPVCTVDWDRGVVCCFHCGAPGISTMEELRPHLRRKCLKPDFNKPKPKPTGKGAKRAESAEEDSEGAEEEGEEEEEEAGSEEEDEEEEEEGEEDEEDERHPGTYRGVVHRNTGYMAQLKMFGVQKRHGPFETAMEAAKMYDACAVADKGDRAIVNFPKDYPHLFPGGLRQPSRSPLEFNARTRDMWCDICLDEPDVEMCCHCGCRVCFSKQCADELLLCDSCEREWHMRCLDPVLTEIPSGQWFCPQCVADKDEAAKAATANPAGADAPTTPSLKPDGRRGLAAGLRSPRGFHGGRMFADTPTSYICADHELLRRRLDALRRAGLPPALAPTLATVTLSAATKSASGTQAITSALYDSPVFTSLTPSSSPLEGFALPSPPVGTGSTGMAGAGAGLPAATGKPNVTAACAEATSMADLTLKVSTAAIDAVIAGGDRQQLQQLLSSLRCCREALRPLAAK